MKKAICNVIAYSIVRVCSGLSLLSYQNDLALMGALLAGLSVLSFPFMGID